MTGPAGSRDAAARLLDVEAIKVLKARYFRYVDTRDWPALRELFTDDARFEFPGLGTFEDVEAGLAKIRSALGSATTIHHGHMPEITLTGSDTAEGIWAMHDYVIRHGAAGGDEALPGYAPEFQRGLRGYGHYLETYRRVGSGWLIASLKLTRLHIEPLHDGAAHPAQRSHAG